MPPQPFRLSGHEFGIRPYFGLSSTMAKGQVGEREAELMLKWRKQGRSLNEIMTLTGRTKVTVLNHTDPERKPRTGSGRPKCIGSKAFVKLEKALDRLQKRVDGCKEVTVSKVKHSAGIAASDRTVLPAVLFYAALCCALGWAVLHWAALGWAGMGWASLCWAGLGRVRPGLAGLGRAEHG